jgi:H+/gluconate symporter-like permease
MNPVAVGSAVAAVLAGPPLYALVQTGQMDGTTALLRGLLVAAICSVAAGYVLQLIDNYDQDRAKRQRHEQLLTAIAQAEAAQKRHTEALAKQAEQARQKSS